LPLPERATFSPSRRSSIKLWMSTLRTATATALSYACDRGNLEIYLSSEDGDIFVVKAGPKYELIASNPMGEVLMATPAISDG
jgi:hypothetical protein